MEHLTQDELVLYHYGEVEDLASWRAHLSECGACAADYRELQRVLAAADDVSVPERGEDYGAAVWQCLQPRLSRRQGWRSLFLKPWRSGRNWALAAAMAGLIVAAFFIGRLSTPRVTPATAGAEPVRERVLLVAVGDHLERSQMVLVELANARPEGKTDISMQRDFAADLVDANRLFRQTAAQSGDADIAGILDELERVLIEIAHSPSEVSAAQLRKIQGRIESQGIIFKVRVIGSKMRDAEGKPAGEPAPGVL